MLQCAQAWYQRNSVSLDEAVRTMNILSLRIMQQSLDARQELLHTLMTRSFTRPQIPSTNPHLSSPAHFMPSPSGRQMQEGDDEKKPSSILSEEQEEMHAPLLRRHQSSILGRSAQLKAPHTVDTSVHTAYQVRDDLETYDINAAMRPVRLTSSPSAPAFSTTQETVECHNRNMPACAHNSYYENLSATNKSKDADYSRSNSSTSSLSDEIGDRQWESWFAKNGQTNYCCFYCKNCLASKRLSADEADVPMMRTDDTTTGISEAKFKEHDISFFACEKTLIGKTESSISTFRPISKNLAPRCAPAPKRSSSSSYACSRSSWQDNQPTITKSRSFPSKIAALGRPKHCPPMPVKTPKERNFVMQSIVNKKVSLSKLFSSKKSVAGSN
ncbi:hypothetical protein EC973_003919 [Apophysomyces ossiformis]|uniref:Uncharacterized protein n=1 Tax=Apophysomyces ossiformis TaxID=679940 RepID=A0A8H7BHF0_9FUNG|nr:hypothetical protein EC973_003919 [Apophysomyces ossiformis]